MTTTSSEPCRVNGVALEVLRVTPEIFDAAKPAIILLHEGLGSVSMWRDFPLLLAEHTECEVIVYSRAGYGRSDSAQLPRTVHYMHDEGLDVLPELIQQMGISRPILMGHSDGGSIALICAGGSDIGLSGLIVMAPHIKNEKITVDSIAQAKNAWQQTELPARLARYHDDVEAAFKGWNDIWLQPDFLSWNIEEYLPAIKVPILAIQGEDDEYGTMQQIDGIKRLAPQTELLKLEKCRHSPHKDQPQALLSAVVKFIDNLVEDHINGIHRAC
jgi:pimeloyl-ACP methyl ester carboxylesterase